MENENNIETKFANLIKARYPYIYIPTWEEDRVVKMINSAANDTNLFKDKRKVYVWSQTKGFKSIEESFTKNNIQYDPSAALNAIANSKEDAIFVLKDFHNFFGANNRPGDNNIIRKLRDLIPYLRSDSENLKTVVFVSPVLNIPNDLQKDISILEFPLPTKEELAKILDNLINVNSSRLENNLTVEEKDKLIKAALGLTFQEAENAFARAMVELKGINIDALNIILDEKNQVIKKTGILEFIKSDLDINDVGGLENLKSWLMKRNKSWLDNAKKYNIPTPKGILITGVPGCGKSLTAKATSAMWKLPLLKLDIGKIFSGLVGSSEENIRKAIATAEAVAPSILWVDEIEKGLAGANNGSGDGGTSTRVFGTFLTWMQEKTAPVFVIATANNISNLPPELLRKGRFDEIFFVDLPTKREREKIFELHLKKRLTGVDIIGELKLNEDLYSKLAEISEGFVGAEIEEVIIAALYEAFFENRDLTENDLIKCIKNTVPLCITQKEQIKALREWANVRAVAATSKEDLGKFAFDKSNDEKPAPSLDIKEKRGGRILDF